MCSRYRCRLAVPAIDMVFCYLDSGLIVGDSMAADASTEFFVEEQVNHIASRETAVYLIHSIPDVPDATPIAPGLWGSFSNYDVIQKRMEEDKISPSRVMVAACGPAALMRCVRDETARAIGGDGPAVELHCEQFGW